MSLVADAVGQNGALVHGPGLGRKGLVLGQAVDRPARQRFAVEQRREALLGSPGGCRR